VDQWRIVHWKWQEIWRLEGKAVPVFSETVRGKDICCSAEWIDYDKMLSMQVLQRTTQWHCPSCVTTHEGSGSLTWRVNGQYRFVCIVWPSQHCTTLTNYPNVTRYVIQTFHNWLYSGGRAVVYSVDKTLSSPCRSGLAHETKSHCARMRMASILRLNYWLLHPFNY